MSLLEPDEVSAPPTIKTVLRDELGFIVRVLGRHGVRQSDLADVAQEVLRAIHRGLSDLDLGPGETDRLRGWIYGIAYRQAQNHHRRVRRLRVRDTSALAAFAPPGSGSNQGASPDPTPEESVIQDENRRLVRRLIESIEPTRRAVFQAVDLDGLTVLEAAEAFQIPYGTAKNRLRLARHDFRQAWERHQLQQAHRVAGVLAVNPLALLALERAIPEVPAELRAELSRRLDQMLQEESGLGLGGAGTSRSAPLAPLSRPRIPGLWPPSEWPRRLAGPLLALAPHVVPTLLPAGVGAGVGGGIMFALLSRGPAAPQRATQSLRPIPADDGATICAAPLATSAMVTSEGPGPAGAAPDGVVTEPVATPRRPLVASQPGTAPRPVRERPETATPAKSAAPTIDESLAVEQQVLRAAQVAIDRGDTSGARKGLEEHARRFPKSRLATMREVAWIRVLLREGKRPEAALRAAAIKRALPSTSSLVRTLDALIPLEVSP